jgi:hypothetical protein
VSRHPALNPVDVFEGNPLVVGRRRQRDRHVLLVAERMAVVVEDQPRPWIFT